MEKDFLLNAALEYARRGKYVFPCGMDKKPLIKGGYKSASRNLSQIRDWWRRWPQAMIGMPTGNSNGFMAIDCDREDGIANFLELCAQDGYTPETSWQTTPGGGRHYLFLMPEQEIKCSANKLAPHVDVRADGGYIICAPSIREDGKSYEWRANGNLSPLPQPLLTRLLNLKNAKSPKRKRESSVPDAYAKKALYEETAKVRAAKKQP